MEHNKCCNTHLCKYEYFENVMCMPNGTQPHLKLVSKTEKNIC